MPKNFKNVVHCFLASAALIASASFAEQNLQDTPQTPYISVSSEDISILAAGAPIVTLASGAWVSSGAGPTLTNKGLTYSLTLPVVGSVPAGATISSSGVNYSWNLSTIPSGLTVLLCYNGTSCVNVTGAKNGNVTFWGGQLANKSFVYKFSVSGTGSIFPVAYGQTDQVIVNYN